MIVEGLLSWPITRTAIFAAATLMSLLGAQDPKGPRVIETLPANGAQDVPAGITEIRWDFDREMADTRNLNTPGSSYDKDMADPKFREFAQSIVSLEWSKDKRSLVLVADLKPETRYEIGFNGYGKSSEVKDAQGQLAEPCLLKFTTGRTMSGIQSDPGVWIEALATIWAEVKFGFIYYDKLTVDWDKRFREFIPIVREAKSTLERKKAFMRFASVLNDGHSGVFYEGVLAPRLNLPFSLDVVEERPVLCEVDADDPEVKKHGVTAGFELSRINGRDVSNVLEEELFPFASFSTPQEKLSKSVRFHLARLIKPGDELTLRDVGGRKIAFKASPSDKERPWSRRPPYEHKGLGEGIEYFRLSSFDPSRMQAHLADFQATLTKILHTTKGVVLDVRNGEGGDGGLASAFAARFFVSTTKGSVSRSRRYVPTYRAWGQFGVSKGTLQYEELSTFPQPASSALGQGAFRGPVAILTSSGTISASEDFLVPFKQSKRAVLVGERTAGSTGQPLQVRLPGGGTLWICTKHDRFPDGTEFVGVGIVPDVEVRPTRKDIAAGADPVLDEAVTVLRGKIAQGFAIEPPRIAQERPRIVFSLPENNAKDVPTDLPMLVVRFDQRMSLSSGYRTAHIKANEKEGIAYPPLPAHARFSSDGTTCYITLGKLKPNSKYGLPFGPQFKGENGKELGLHNIVFTTGPE